MSYTKYFTKSYNIQDNRPLLINKLLYYISIYMSLWLKKILSLWGSYFLHSPKSNNAHRKGTGKSKANK